MELQYPPSVRGTARDLVRIGEITGFAAFLLSKARAGTAFEESDRIQGFDPKTGKSAAGEA